MAALPMALNMYAVERNVGLRPKALAATVKFDYDVEEKKQAGVEPAFNFYGDAGI